MNNEILGLLRNNPHFSGLDDELVVCLSNATSMQHYEANQTIFVRGDPPDALYVLVKGKIAIEVTASDGRIARVATLSPGEYFGEFAILDGGGRTADARAFSAATVLRIGASAYRQHLLNNSDYLQRIIEELISKIRGTDLQIERLSLKSVRQRIAFLLLDLLEQEGSEDMVISITQAEIADRLVASREKVNVNLQDIMSSGAIELGRGKIKIIDAEVLSAFVNQ